jgi:hypothetical protein
MGPIDQIRLRELAGLQAALFGLTEENVKQIFLVPLLEALGHERRNLDFERNTQGRRLDVFVRGLRDDCKVIAETKRYGEDLDQHLPQIGGYAAAVGALITVITNGVEVRLYSLFGGISFERCLLHSIRREELATAKAATLEKFLSRSSLTSREVHQHIDERERQLRAAYSKLEELNDRYDVSRQNLNAEVADLESQVEDIQDKIATKHNELSEMETRHQMEEASIWQQLGFRPPAEERHRPIVVPEPPERPLRIEEPHPPIDFTSLILQTLRELGGQGNVRDVLRRIESKLRDQGKLTRHWSALDPREIRWVHATHTARVRLVKQGKLRRDSERGMWELT